VKRLFAIVALSFLLLVLLNSCGGKDSWLITVTRNPGIGQARPSSLIVVELVGDGKKSVVAKAEVDGLLAEQPITISTVDLANLDPRAQVQFIDKTTLPGRVTILISGVTIDVMPFRTVIKRGDVVVAETIHPQ